MAPEQDVTVDSTYPFRLRVVLRSGDSPGAGVRAVGQPAQPAQVPVQVARGAVRAGGAAAAAAAGGRAAASGAGARRPADAPLREPRVAGVAQPAAARLPRAVAVVQPLAGEAVRAALAVALPRGAGHGAHAQRHAAGSAESRPGDRRQRRR